MDAIHKIDKFTMNTYKRFKVIFVKGNGMYLFDTDGNRYLDFLAGVAVNALGHLHPVMVDTIKRQSEKLIHISNLYYSNEQANLSEYLIKNSVFDRVFFSNSGAESNETAIKLARIWGSNKGKYKIVSMQHSFHGRTMFALSATAQKQYQKGFGPIPGGFAYAKFNDFDDLKEKVDDKTCAVMFEFIQGEGGINVADYDYVKKARNYCFDKNILFVADEVQTGMGRTGKLFAYQHYDVEPDIATLSKALGGGIPIAATLAKEDAAKHFTYGSHGSTFGGSPFASAVSLSVIKFINESGLLSHVKDMGNYLIKKLDEIASKKSSVDFISGMGLIVGVHMKNSKAAEEMIKKAFEHRILLGKAGDRTIRIEPPLIVEKEHINELLSFFNEFL